MKDKVEKKNCRGVNRYEKQEEEKETFLYLEIDSEKNTRQSQSTVECHGTLSVNDLIY